ncbi:Protein of unknown function DUF262 [Pseudomonas sp. NFACC15-1]|uniref:DUF262 domain-containing protein n=1 Tax=unclassified Pseudomonas TaxID=196821 RepID=UPI00088C160D|nr:MULTISPECIES: DUF262 domain-containing protein [unclassified Pseudomonas]SDA73590.1 Protein of unknown function DUF262 [Pseudomonas sp. NFACC15-1]SDY25603.1 Protein of unknown function DUF262 [Pseudomonas sp. NFACC14]
MSEARQHSFATLFSSVDGVEIPIIQRDYAQGRKQSTDVLDGFLTSLWDALNSEHEYGLDLDFIYGTFEDGAGRVLSLLDGQQRLTTLFLLHWYTAMCEGQLEDFRGRWTKGGRSRFTYATRPSSAEFFDALANAVIAPPADGKHWNGKLSAHLVDSNWFFLSWRSDPTVAACLTTLNSIAQKFGVTRGLYARLVDEQQPKITFHFLDLERFGLTDDLYIKMNARGKPLTPFEHFKAWLVRSVASEPWARRFDLAMDQKWMDLFWRLASQKKGIAIGQAVDELYLRFMYVMAFFDSCNRIERAYGASRSTIEWITKLRHARGYIPLRELEAQGAFNPSSAQVVSVVLDHFCDTASASDLKTLEKALAPNSDYLDLIRLFCVVAWVDSPAAKSGSPELEIERSRWDRITSNLLANHRVDDVYIAILAVKGVQALASHVGNLYESLSKAIEPPAGFSGEQAKEEVRKVGLIVEDPTREASFIEAEAHPYLQGKIGFLLDFSTPSDGPLDLDAFARYSERARAVLDEGVRASTDHLLERALLSMDDYLIGRGSSKFSFCQPDAGTYRDRSENWLRVIGRREFQNLLDRIEGNANAALQQIIETAVCTDWRRYVVAEPQLIDYCGERLIHREESGDIYLLSRKRLSGYHAELSSYALFLALKRSKGALPGMTYYYSETYDDTQPALVLQGSQELRVSYGAGAWQCSGPTGLAPLPELLLKFMGEHCFIAARD